MASFNPLYNEQFGFQPSAHNFSVLNIARFITEYPLVSVEEGRSYTTFTLAMFAMVSAKVRIVTLLCWSAMLYACSFSPFWAVLFQ